MPWVLLMAATASGAVASSTRVGVRAAMFKQPVGVAVDTHGNVYVVDNALSRVTKLSPSGHVITAWGQHGSKAGQFGSAEAIALGPDGSVYVADGGNARIDKFSPGGKLLA